MDYCRAKSINDFKNYLEENEYSENTIRSYCSTIQAFINTYKSIDISTIHEYKTYLINNKKITTVNQRINALNNYIVFMDLSFPKLKTISIIPNNYENNVITTAELDILKTALQKQQDKTCYFVIRFLASTGMRISELLCITSKDIKIGYIDILSKNHKERRVYFPTNLTIEAQKWIETQEMTNGAIFRNKRGNKLSASGARYLIKKYGEECHIDSSHMHPHAFRHRYAQNFMDKTGNIALLSDILGHNSIDTTRIYLRKSNSEQKEMIDRIVNW